jgi:hypothetical protein
VTTRQSNRPSFMAAFLFFLLFSGPPRFRERDPTASLRGEIDLVVIFHLAVWALAGMWVFYQMRFYFQANAKSLGLRLPQKLGLGMVAALGMSTFVSVSPPLTAFMVYQMLISLMFTMIFVERYGVEACLTKLLQASAVMCVAIAVAALAFSDLVLVTTETGATRLRGDNIAPTEVVSLFSLVLLLAGVQKISKITYGLLLGLSCTLLVASLSRTVYLAVFGIFLLVLFKRPTSKPFRRFAYIVGLAVVPLIALSSAFDLSKYRNPEGVWTLSDRLNLWAYLSHVTLQESPWLGFGYYAGGRAYGIAYNADLASPHSIFFETFVGGGLLAITILVILCVVMTAYVAHVFLRQDTSVCFAVTILFLVTLMFGSIGSTLESGPVAIVFWSLAASLPILRNKGLASARTAVTFRKELMEAR